SILHVVHALVSPTAAFAGDPCQGQLDGTPCPDGDLCDGDETCQGGVCTPGALLDCDDHNPCTDDLCDGVQGCLHSNNSAGCTDGNACSTNDVCNGGTCVGGPPGPGCTSCDAAATIPAGGGTFIGTTSGTGTLTGTCSLDGLAPERVYKWTPTTTGQSVLATCGDATTFDTRLYVMDGTCGGAVLGCDDDAPGCATAQANGSPGSRITMNVTAGQTYYVVVDGYNGQHGTYQLTVGAPTVCGNGV